MKNENSKKPERIIKITPTTKILIDQTDVSQKFTIKTEEPFGKNNENEITFMTEDLSEGCKWILMLRSLTYNGSKMSMNDFEIISVIGRGFYGKVMLCKLKETGELYAIKTVHKDRLIKSNRVHTVLRERDIMVKARNPFIVSLHYAFQTDSKFYLVLEYVPGGELYRLMNSRNETFPFKQSQLYVAEVGLALDYLHSIGVIYRDLKPENILINSDGHLKLADFGLSKIIQENHITSTFCGTAEYVAPEIIKRSPYSFPIDWWSLGIFTYELLYGDVPFPSSNRATLFDKIINSEPDFPDYADPVHIDFILQLLQKDPQKRATFESLKEHPFWEGLNLEDVKQLKTKPIYIPSSVTEENFDSEFTTEAPLDSTNAVPTDQEFKGFSFSQDPPVITDPSLQPSILSVDPIL